jgi:uncharacterized Tic20 family protein
MTVRREEQAMIEQTTANQDERVMAALAHVSILLGLLTSGLGGIGAALLIWLTQKEESAYAAFQALQAAVYQVVAFIVSMMAWLGWGLLWMAMLLPPLFTNPAAYDKAPPPGLWIGLILMVVPIGISGLIHLYALCGAVRCLGGHDFKYVVIGNWLECHR